MAAEFANQGREPRRQKLERALDTHYNTFSALVAERGVSVPIAENNGDTVYIKAFFDDEDVTLPPRIAEAVAEIYPQTLPARVDSITIFPNEARIYFDLAAHELSEEDMFVIGISQSEFRSYGMIYGETDESPKKVLGKDSVPLHVYKTYAEQTKKSTTWGAHEGFFFPPIDHKLEDFAIADVIIFDFHKPRAKVGIVKEHPAGNENDTVLPYDLPLITPKIIDEFTDLATDFIDRPGTRVSVYVEDTLNEEN